MLKGLDMRWKIKTTPENERVEHLMECLGVSKVVAVLLVQRGISTFEEAKAFFRPNWEQLHDPFLMQDMAKAVGRVQLAINQKEPIMVYGDYDVDGTTSVSMLTHFLRSQNVDATPYIPDRYAEGYGLSIQGIDAAHKQNIRCMIALDCGIKAIEQIAYAKSLGIDVIVCDHHTPSDFVFVKRHYGF